MKTFLLTLLIITIAGCAQTLMRTDDEKQTLPTREETEAKGICNAKGMDPVPSYDVITLGFGWRCMERDHDR